MELYPKIGVLRDVGWIRVNCILNWMGGMHGMVGVQVYIMDRSGAFRGIDYLEGYVLLRILTVGFDHISYSCARSHLFHLFDTLIALSSFSPRSLLHSHYHSYTHSSSGL